MSSRARGIVVCVGLAANILACAAGLWRSESLSPVSQELIRQELALDVEDLTADAIPALLEHLRAANAKEFGPHADRPERDPARGNGAWQRGG